MSRTKNDVGHRYIPAGGVTVLAEAAAGVAATGAGAAADSFAGMLVLSFFFFALLAPPE